MIKPSATLSTGLAILPLYLLVTLLIGWLTSRKSRSAEAYLNASRSLPLFVVTAAYLASNCGALEIVGLSAMAAQYGAQAFHFYWIGAIPAMIFLALWMMPVYRRSSVRSVPEYLEFRYGKGVRQLNACILALIMLLLAGISLYAMAQVLEVVLGLSFAGSVLISAAVVLAYVLLGGVRATIYNEVFQLLVMIAGLLPLAIHALRLTTSPTARPASSDVHLWSGLPVAAPNAPLDVVGVVFGLGFVLSFGYWCTDFVQMQRAFSARTDAEARQVPLWAGFGKLLFSMMVVLPGLAAYQVIPSLGSGRRFDQALPTLMTMYYSPTMLGLGLTALAASLMSGLAANVSAFAAIWTQDIYRTRLQTHRSDDHYLLVGRISAIVAIILSLIASYINFLFSNLMEHVQLIFSVFGSPFFAIFLLGMATRRTTERGAIAGFLSGTLLALLRLIALTRGWIHYGSVMSANFYTAIYSFSTAVIVAWSVSTLSARTVQTSHTSLVFHWRTSLLGREHRLLWALSILLLSTCIVLNLLWR